MSASYPVAVPVPSYTVYLLTLRILSMDEGLLMSSGAVPYSTVTFHELLAALPALREGAWRLLQLLLRSCSRQLTPMYRMLSTLLQQHLRKIRVGGVLALLSSTSHERCQLYTCAGELLALSGISCLKNLATEVLGSTMVELYASKAASASADGNSSASSKAGQHRAKKRKTAQDPVSEAELAGAIMAAADAEAAVSPAELRAQGAAVQLLTALTQVGGTVLPPDQRAQLDAAIMHIAATSAKAESRISREKDGAAAAELRALQLSAYQVLLASVLSPSAHRPPFLSQVNGQAEFLLLFGSW